MQLFNYVLQIISFGKVVPFEFKHSKTDLEVCYSLELCSNCIKVDCKHNLSLELAYRKKDEIKDSDKESNNFMLYVSLYLLLLLNSVDHDAMAGE